MPDFDRPDSDYRRRLAARGITWGSVVPPKPGRVVRFRKSGIEYVVMGKREVSYLGRPVPLLSANPSAVELDEDITYRRRWELLLVRFGEQAYKETMGLWVGLDEVDITNRTIALPPDNMRPIIIVGDEKSQSGLSKVDPNTLITVATYDMPPVPNGGDMTFKVSNTSKLRWSRTRRSRCPECGGEGCYECGKPGGP